MPKLHEYRNKRGMYVRAKHGRSLVTYQLAPAATAELRRRGLAEGSEVSPDTLQRLVAAGLAYTHGSGAGIVDAPISADSQSKPRKQNRKRHHPRPSQGIQSYFPPPLPSPRPAVPALPADTSGRLFPASCSGEGGDKPVVQSASAPRTSLVIPEPPHPVAGTPDPALPDSVPDYHDFRFNGFLDVEPDPALADSIPDYQPAPLPPRPTTTLPVVAPISFHWWRKVGQIAERVWAVVTYEFVGIAVWLWLLILVGVLVPSVLIAKLVSGR
jgi:hypothetical protein